MTLAKKPVVLISSTVYDFQDLRSALKFWLSQLGYDVLLSEFNDFQKSLDDNSYDACKKAVAKADYFVLLIGSRVGGWFDANERISITREEYREALRRFTSSGSPKLAVFVRRSVWDVREDRQALAELLHEEYVLQKDLSSEAADRIKNHSSRLVTDAEAIFELIKEVGQVRQMKEASSGSGALPKANWIHQFSTFEDILDALRIELLVETPLAELALRENLRQELTRNLCSLLCKGGDDKLTPIADYGKCAADNMIGGINDQSTMPGRYLQWLRVFRLLAMSIPQRLSSLFIWEAAQAGVFMKFNAQTGAYETSRVHDVLMEVRTLIAASQRYEPDAREVEGFASKYEDQASREEDVEVDNIGIASACGDVKLIARVTDLHRRLLLWLGGKDDALDDLGEWHTSPLPVEVDKMKRKEVTPENVERWLDNG